MIGPGTTVAVLGPAYKPYSHVLEESQGVTVPEALAAVESGLRRESRDGRRGRQAQLLKEHGSPCQIVQSDHQRQTHG